MRPIFKRTIERKTNEEGHFQRLLAELVEIGRPYSKEIDDLMAYWEEANFDKQSLKELL
jgi:hypothetical protein